MFLNWLNVYECPLHEKGETDLVLRITTIGSVAINIIFNRSSLGLHVQNLVVYIISISF